MRKKRQGGVAQGEAVARLDADAGVSR
jgi:hypothetical protein